MFLEREPLVASLREIRPGAMVFVAGEAGIGKTSLVREFCATLPTGTVVRYGFCDALGTPRALGPLHDIARASPKLAGLLTDGADRHTIFTAFLELLSDPQTVVVVEDAHWADEATLDLLLFVGRRISELPALVVVTYRSEEVGRDHTLRRVLGDLATAPSVRRLQVPALTSEAVAALATPLGRDGDEVFAVTGGNPFFVTEVLSAPGDDLPATVRDAVLARAARLGPAARAVLDVVSLVPDRAEVALVDAVGLEECIQAGMLLLEGRSVRFRHELARRAVESDVPAVRVPVLHGQILDYLAEADEIDPARLSYHAEVAGDRAAVLEHAPVAARRAAELGAHRQAAAHYARAVRHADNAQIAVQAELWERHGESADDSGDLAEGIRSSQRATELWQQVGEVERQGATMARCSHMLWKTGRNAEAHALARQAVALLADRPPSPALAQAQAAMARLLMLGRDMRGAIVLGTTAVEYARQFGDLRTLGRALNSVGSAHWLMDPVRAVELLEASLATAGEVGDDAGAAQAMMNLGSGAGEIRRYALADRWLAEAASWCAARDLDSSLSYALAWQSRSRFEQGQWSEATALAGQVVTKYPQHVPSQIVVNTVLGRLRARRGDPDPEGPLSRAWELAVRTGDLQRLWPAAAARAEHAWLQGRIDAVEGLVAETYEHSLELEHPWAVGELGSWLRTAGVTVELPGYVAEPYKTGDGWRELGCTYEAALALTEKADPEQQIAGLQELQQLGAWPAAELVARRLRQSGVQGLPRRPRGSSRENPANLTARETEVLALLAEDLTNAEIGQRLHISPKTVDHHVSSILGKLGVATRQEAARRWGADGRR
ncbi:AAA ATPase-like protein [Kribbella voronezhensis]|uniref:AAA ATPase-like protein n=1 Tax=Kribbella voronezhensis TaxID=2512212 RepID=A0A4R7TG58_9ACTN|nr:LuxR family transcriptional regulator [Kribbella voronezhensis]TDU91231.1 AAA ATPase-like protein [Kribbella voronezhensis]